jgi:hypothetical protein
MEHDMRTTIRLFVLRHLSDHPSDAVELHNRRRNALHDVLDGEDTINVLDWGLTDNDHPQEFVEIILSVTSSIVFDYPVDKPGLNEIALRLRKRAIKPKMLDLIKWLILKLKPKQVSQEILDFQIRLPDGTRIDVHPPNKGGQVRMKYADGTVDQVIL